MPIIYSAPRDTPHHCRPQKITKYIDDDGRFLYFDPAPGSIWRCDTCRRHYFVEPTGMNFSAWWKPLRWWHFLVRRNLPQP